MDSSLLKVFVAVANEKSVSLGAKEINLSQSNVTLRIKQLEKKLGYSLFHRVPKGVILTKEGKKLYPHAIEIVKKVEETILQMRNISHQETLIIGTNQSNSSIRILPFMKKLKKDFPKMKLEFYTAGTPQTIEQVLDYKVDIAFITGNPNHKDLVLLNTFNDDLYMIESKRKKSDNCIIGYRSNSTHYDFIKDYYEASGNNDYKSIIIENYEVMLGCVKEGMGKAFLSKKIIDKYEYAKDLKMTKIEEKGFELKTYLVCRTDYIPMIEKYLRNLKLD